MKNLMTPFTTSFFNSSLAARCVSFTKLSVCLSVNASLDLYDYAPFKRFN